MPKPAKLHPKGKPKALQKSCNTNINEEEFSGETARQFQLELCWCIQKLEHSLSDPNTSEKTLLEAWKVVNILKNNEKPIIRKRQLMRKHFGDYRAKMAAEEKKLIKMANKMKITDTPTNTKATFLRKSLFSTQKEEFKFNFKQPSQNEDHSKTISNENDVKKLTENSNDIKESAIDNSKEFKFKFSNSPFKFDFNSDT